ncbi:MAG: helix-turn-helix transcriptional regulator [Rhodoglobus sp.]
MVGGHGVIDPVLVGRDRELGMLGALLSGAGAGTFGAIIVGGDPGVGKTALIKRSCAAVDASAIVLSGGGLPLGSLSVPFLALQSALRGMPQLTGDALPRMLASGDSAPHVPAIFDAWLSELCHDRLVVLVVDDLHWVDQSTLDVLMYLLAGPADRRLAVIAGIRSSEAGDGYPVARWLADIRRLPQIAELTLGPLDRLGTGAQISGLLGAPPRQSLVEDVFAHTQGNAYLTQLVVAGLSADALRLPADLPADLKSAVLQSWRRLSAPARALTRILAVGGRPLRAADLDAVIAGSESDGGADAGGSLPLLREAVDAGTLDANAHDTYWFHHPLNAEVLEEGLPGEERRRWHAAFADHYEAQLTDATPPAVETMVALADHHFQAAHGADAYRWALRATEAAGAAGGVSEMLRLLRRAVALRDQVPEASESTLDLLRRLRAAAAETGAQEEELDAIEALLRGLNPDEHPLTVAELLVRRAQLRLTTGRSFLNVAELSEAVRLASVDETSWQYALALAELAHAELWQDSPDAGAHADRALAVARAAGSPRSLSFALSVNAMAAVFSEHGDQARTFAAEAVDAAMEARDYWAFVHATLWEANGIEMWASRTFASHLARRREQLTALGAPHVYIAKLSADEAMGLLAIGDWRECQQRLRVVLGSDPGPFADVGARLTAARLAAWQGRQSEAAAHMARADELFAGTSEFLAIEFDAIRAEVCLAAGDPRAAYAAAMTGATSPGVPPTMCEWLIPLAARAIADQVQLARDAGHSPDTLLAQLDDLEERFPSGIRDLGESTELWEHQIDALNLFYAAEAGRARRQEANGRQWILTADACRVGMLAWEEVYACWRAAEALLTRGHAHRDEAASVLRRGHTLAETLQARPIQEALANLAASARIPIDSNAAPDNLAGTTLPGLTPREEEILVHVVAGRTYAEIALALFISEKTVSSHISNLLRKTGSANRVDLARLAMQDAARFAPEE